MAEKGHSGALAISADLPTLADLLRYGDGLLASCPGCVRWVQLDLDRLAERRGRDLLLQEVRQRLRCQACGGGDTETAVGHSFR